MMAAVIFIQTKAAFMTTSPKTCHHPIHNNTNPLAEKNTLRAVMLTAVMMVLEIIGGWYYNSMALLADGWHMSSHVVALGLALFAYVMARRLAQDGRFSFGTWKIEVLGAYTSAILLLLVAVTMLYHSGERLINPAQIHYNEAIALATLGLAGASPGIDLYGPDPLASPDLGRVVTTQHFDRLASLLSRAADQADHAEVSSGSDAAE